MIEKIFLFGGLWVLFCVIWFNTKDFYEGDRWWDLPFGATCFMALIIWAYLSDVVSKWSKEK